ncbi:MAG: DNA gyrase inhibitor YacG [Deltaproteobacteria bacterium]|nr:DNA gyrase inhibitor YacG [Deltaproteobacteria bacterium]
MASPCPICRRPVALGRPQNPDAPFCSPRCRTVDLGRWLDGAYAIAVEEEAPTIPEAPRRSDA